LARRPCRDRGGAGDNAQIASAVSQDVRVEAATGGFLSANRDERDRLCLSNNHRIAHVAASNLEGGAAMKASPSISEPPLRFFYVDLDGQ